MTDNLNQRHLALREVMMPRNTNFLGSIFGGHILSLIDLAAGQHARGLAPHRYVTKVMREVNFLHPVFTGDAVSFYTQTLKRGHTSVTIRVEVEAHRFLKAEEIVAVTNAEVVMVAVDEHGRPIPI